MKKIILTGGGTAGHVTPNLALIPSLPESLMTGFLLENCAGILTPKISQTHSA